MARWRVAAIECLPDFGTLVASAENIYSLWNELRLKFDAAYRPPRNDEQIGRIYSYADWCRQAPRSDDPAHDPSTAVMVCFYEHIPERICHAGFVSRKSWI